MATQFRKIFAHICNGYQEVWFPGIEGEIQKGFIFIKHLNNSDLAELDILSEQFRQEAIEKELKQEVDREKEVLNLGLWDQKKDIEINNSKLEIEELQKTKAKLSLKNQIEQVDSRIQKAISKYNELTQERIDALGPTAERYQSKKFSEMFVIRSLFQDKDMKIRLIQDEQFDSMQERDFATILSFYNIVTVDFSIESIKRLALEDFAMEIWGLCQDEVSQFFGRRICDLTRYQINFATYSNIFRELVKRGKEGNWPSHVMKDPDKLMEYSQISANSEKIIGESQVNQGAVSMVGAQRKELAERGIEVSDAVKQEAAKTGKKRLTYDDMLRIHGS